ncbi:MAG: exodeoxyribonuclease VII large subunit [Pseudomonadota bacterium]
MDELIEDGRDGPGTGNTPEYAVSEISGAIKKTLEGAFGRIRVRGEVGRVFVARSGHIYFDIKDDRNVLGSVCWKGSVSRLSQRPEEGMEVIATGRLTTFGSQSKYQLTVEDIEPAGVGALMAMLEKRKALLAAEGLFEEGRKRPLPFLPDVIGVVTSPSGAVIRDILHRLGERFPRRVLVWPVAVQGKDCAPQVARAIAGFNAIPAGGRLPRPDLLIVARGGGSIEDLWGFNEEVVARAAAASEIPLISAVGHETDTTLIDYVSDWRAPTPTAAAERAVPVRLDLLAHVDGLGARLAGGLSRGLHRQGERLRDLGRALPSPAQLLAGPRQRLDAATLRLPQALRGALQSHQIRLTQASATLRPQIILQRLRRQADRVGDLSARLSPTLMHRSMSDHARDRARLSERLDTALRQNIAAQRTRVEGFERLLNSLSYVGTLERGYAVVRDGSGQVLTRLTPARGAPSLEIQFADGRLAVQTVAAEDAAPPAPPSPAKTKRTRKKAPPKPPTGQGSLF